jgi:hypothetical protein
MTRLHTYLNFEGNAEETSNFYKSVFGGKISSLVRFRDPPRSRAAVLRPSLERSPEGVDGDPRWLQRGTTSSRGWASRPTRTPSKRPTGARTTLGCRVQEVRRQSDQSVTVLLRRYADVL